MEIKRKRKLDNEQNFKFVVENGVLFICYEIDYGVLKGNEKKCLVMINNTVLDFQRTESSYTIESKDRIQIKAIYQGLNSVFILLQGEIVEIYKNFFSDSGGGTLVNSFPSALKIKKFCAGTHFALFSDDTGNVYGYERLHCLVLCPALGRKFKDVNSTIKKITVDFKVIDIACNHSSSVLLSDVGHVWVCGQNSLDQCGSIIACPFSYEDNECRPTLVSCQVYYDFVRPALEENGLAFEQEDLFRVWDDRIISVHANGSSNLLYVTKKNHWFVTGPQNRVLGDIYLQQYKRNPNCVGSSSGMGLTRYHSGTIGTPDNFVAARIGNKIFISKSGPLYAEDQTGKFKHNEHAFRVARMSIFPQTFEEIDFNGSICAFISKGKLLMRVAKTDYVSHTGYLEYSFEENISPGIFVTSDSIYAKCGQLFLRVKRGSRIGDCSPEVSIVERPEGELQTVNSGIMFSRFVPNSMSVRRKEIIFMSLFCMRMVNPNLPRPVMLKIIFLVFD
jgi:hypothetical protein